LAPKINSIEDVESLALENPDEFDRLLKGYFRLLGSRPKVWWQDDAGAMDERWSSCIRQAIAQLAAASGVPTRTLADWLDDEALPRARAKVIELAKARLV
jgi:hypothetical protein